MRNFFYLTPICLLFSQALWAGGVSADFAKAQIENEKQVQKIDRQIQALNAQKQALYKARVPDIEKLGDVLVDLAFETKKCSFSVTKHFGYYTVAAKNNDGLGSDPIGGKFSESTFEKSEDAVSPSETEVILRFSTSDGYQGPKYFTVVVDQNGNPKNVWVNGGAFTCLNQ